MNATSKAPKGGLTSQVNGQFYEGGQFVPDHGLFCGAKGAKRRERVEKAQATNRYFDLSGNRLFESRRFEGDGVWTTLGIVLATSHRDVTEHAKTTFGTGCYTSVEL
jgi:hypothetical protein